MTISIIFIVVTSLCISVILTRILSKPSYRLQIIDYPNERSLHTEPVSRVGGLAILATIIFVSPIVTLWLTVDISLLLIVLGALIISIISFIDDRIKLNAGIRLIFHIIAATLLLIAGYGLNILELPMWQWHWPITAAVIVTLLYVVWLINLYNFMDGMDGFAGGMTIIGFLTFALLGLQENNMLFAILCLVIASSTLGFLFFNFPPAKIFMGDVGSSTLGFLVAAFSLWASRDGIFPLWVSILVFSPFIVDATLTLIRRLIGGEKIWEAHKSHYYQRLVQLGWGHRRTVLWEYLLMILCAISAIASTKIDELLQWGLLIIWIIIYSILIYYIYVLENRQRTCNNMLAKG